MQTRSRWFHLHGLFLLSVGLALGSMLSASAFAGPSTSRDLASADQRAMQQQYGQKKIVYLMMSSASPIPKPIEWLSGIPTTTIPMDVIGRGYVVTR
jgi:membrane protein YqaA with SNARE-associated domain